MLEAKNKLPLEGLNKILIRGTNWIGDAVMTLPAVASVRAAYPGAHLSVLAKPPVSDIYKMFSAADEILPYPRKFDNAPGVLRLAYSLRPKKFDAAILLQNAIEAAIIAYVAGIGVRAGYSTDGRGFLLTHPVRRSADILRVHQIDYYLEMVKALGCADVDRSLRLETSLSTATTREILRKYLPENNRPLIGIAPGAMYGPAKRWLPERFAQAGESLAKKLDAQVLLFGGGDDWETAELVRGQAQTDMMNLAGRTSLEDSVYLISQCRLFLSNDSGLMHVAGGLNIPTVAIFGSTNPVTTSPAGERTTLVRKETPCSPCLKKTCPTDFRCMTAVTVEDVVEAALTLINGTTGPRPDHRKS
ncbi:MAG TPA: lipopolysaccharide heptosyltransferase II [Smithellaceae bacterium]|jgi:heptosyltransferase-2|nr:lipopolysaccharide heptosyltransferase II [Smithellaceae bacterium]HPL32906.1 lipopolysaccharide heptosyltransferase II [Smithellaceae bacterium]